MPISCGMPAVLPVTQPNTWSRSAASMNTACWPEANWPTDSAMPPTASVAMNDGTRSRVDA